MQNFFTKLDSPVEGSGGVYAPPSNPDDSAPWWMRYAAKGAGVIGGIGKHLKTRKFRVGRIASFDHE